MLISGATTSFQQISEIRRKLGIGPLAAGVPIGGALNQVLVKLSATDYDTGFATLLGGLITAGNGIVFAGNTVHFAQAAAYTPGAVPFATGAGTMGFDAANLFWNAADARLGLGTNAPTDRFHVAEAYGDLIAHNLGNFLVTTSLSGGNKRALFASLLTTGAAVFAAGLPTLAAVEVFHGKGALGTGAVDATIGIRIQSRNNAAGNIADTYDCVIATPNLIGGGLIGTNYAIWQENPAAFSKFWGNIDVGSYAGPFHDNDIIRCERTFTTAGHPTGVAAILGFTSLANTNEWSAAGSFTDTTTGGINFTNGDAVIACLAQGAHNGTGSCFAVTGGRFTALKWNQGEVKYLYGGRFYIGNLNATGPNVPVIGAFGIRLYTPTGPGAITTYVGIHLEPGAIAATCYGIQQVGAADLNYFAGFTAFGSTAPVNTTFALFGASTAAISSLRVPRGTAFAYAGTVEGDFWNDFIQHCLTGYIAGLKQFDTRSLFIQTESVTIGNSDVETTLFGAGVGSLTLPVNFWTTGKNLRIRLSGFWASNALSDFRIRVYLAAVNVWDSGVQSLVGSSWSARTWKLDVDTTCRTTGAGGTEITQGLFLGISGSAVGSLWTMPAAVETTATGIDTTAAMAVNVTVTWSAADANDTITCTNATVEVLA